MSKASNRIVNLITQATQAVEKGQLPIRMPENNGTNGTAANGTIANGMTAGANVGSTANTTSGSTAVADKSVGVLTEEKQSLRTSLAHGLTGAGLTGTGLSVNEQEMNEQELSEVCQAFQHMTDAICKRDRERMHFMATAAHDLNNPLMVISGAARTLRYDDVPLDERRQCLDRLMRNVVALQYIVAELTDKVQAQTGQLRLHFEEIELTALVREVVADFSASVTSHPVHFEGDGACPIVGDRQRLHRLLLNLLSNAIKYSDAGREVTVSVWQRNAQVFLSVQDRGIGVSPSDVERMFLPFKRLEHSCTMADGSGMGLVSVQKIVEAHGAEIRVQGAPRQGTIVEICFKLANDRD